MPIPLISVFQFLSAHQRFDWLVAWKAHPWRVLAATVTWIAVVWPLQAHGQALNDLMGTFSTIRSYQASGTRAKAHSSTVSPSQTRTHSTAKAPFVSTASAAIDADTSFTLWVRVSHARVAPAKKNQPITLVDLTFDSPTDVRLTEVSSPDARSASIFRTVDDHSSMEKHMVSSWPIPAGKTTALYKEGGQIGLIGIRKDLKNNDTVLLYLTFSDEQGHVRTQTVFAQVTSTMQTSTSTNLPRKPFQFMTSPPPLQTH
jgi:copper(I)-binding protein